MSIGIVGKKCCGCRTCITVCPVDAISFVIDKYGFEFPIIEQTKCLNCGKCELVCPALHVVTGNERYSCGAACALDSNIKKQGSSGGLFGVFAKRILVGNGIVFGAAFDQDLKLKTASAENEKELEPLYKSKYILCDTNNQFARIHKELTSGRDVLYCSSPCQIAALKLYLGENHENLLTVDFVCHGVGSQSLFDKSIAFSQKKLDCTIKKVIFRYKFKNASSHYYYYYYCEKENQSFEKRDIYLSFPYYNAYCKQLLCRDCCYYCQYATEGRASDVTIGDFHRIERYNKTIDRMAGVSMYLCNTKKGQKFFDSLSDKLYVEKMDW
ncbi:MAG: 4Fe-4S dicluster domain-containing protein, partial [Clostridia bacterium]|nr:4Fe-4S dicluster domain-containing protein [Clostridia bacterium]